MAMLCALLSGTSCDRINSSEKLFKQIEERYSNNWYSNVRFKMSISRIINGYETRNSCSAEYLFPSQLIIKSNPLTDDGFLYRNDSIYSFMNGELVGSAANSTDPILISLDAFNYKDGQIKNTIETKFHVNTEKFCTYTDTATNKKMYIVGIDKIDQETTEGNIWFDKETLFLQKI
ncbi:MAG: hypothetical protein HUK15_00795, partial [Bacteroidales bacterium]|nr:hypothetical protein [Bacteroidales bacterium]